MLAGVWANDTSWSEVHDLPHVRLRRSLQGTLYLRPDQIYSDLAAARRYVVRLVRTLQPGHWWSIDRLAEQAYRLHARFLVEQRSRSMPNAWQLTDLQGGQTDLMRPSDWKLVGTPFIREVVRELAWLGIVATAPNIQALQITPLGTYLLGLSETYVPEPRPAVLHVDGDLRVALDVAVADASVLSMLEHIGDLERFEAGSFRYRITAHSLRDALARGYTLSAILDFLAQHSQSLLPEAAQSRLERWAGGFGQAQIYNGLALIELADELLLPELLRSTSLRSALLEQLSPQLLLIDPARSDALWAELVAKGYTPQRVRRTGE